MRSSQDEGAPFGGMGGESRRWSTERPPSAARTSTFPTKLPIRLAGVWVLVGIALLLFAFLTQTSQCSTEHGTLGHCVTTFSPLAIWTGLLLLVGSLAALALASWLRYRAKSRPLP